MRHIDLISAELPDATLVRIEDGASGIVVIRDGDRVTAYEDSCPHAQWRLSDGELVNGVLECPGHGWEFCTNSGQCLNVPAYRLKPIAVTHVGAHVRLHLETGVVDAPVAVPLG
jgi:nitrite reductase/ring-hydroxylating ferredoxin subunit